jgi:hypothetical protein
MVTRFRQFLNNDICALGTLMFVVAMTRFPTLGQPLLERHDFRQTQTAYQALSFAKGEGSILRPHLPIFGEPWELPLEFPFFQLIASYVYRLSTMSIDKSVRVTALVFFLLCFPPLYSLARKLMSRKAAYAVVFIFAFSPFNFQWSRASLIEYAAVFFGLVFVNLMIKISIKPTLVDLAGATIFGSVAGLVKATTLVPMILFSIVICTTNFGKLRPTTIQRKTLVLFSLPILISLTVARVWTSWADKIRLQNPATTWLSEKSLSKWNYGTVSQRLQMDNWKVIFDRVDYLILGHFAWILLLGVAVFFAKSRTKFLAVHLSVFMTIFVFFNLYVIHDYYLIAISPLLVLQFGFALDEMSLYLTKKRFSFPLIFIVFILLLPDSFDSAKAYWALPFKKFEKQTSELARLSLPNQYSFASFEGWNPRLLYEAQRKGMMLDSRATSIEYLRSLSDLKKYDFYTGLPDRPDVMQIRGWYLPVGVITTRLDDEIGDFMPWGLALGAMTATLSNNPSSSELLKCDGIDSFDLSRFKTGSTLTTTSSKPGSFVLSPVLQPVPIGGQIKILGLIDTTVFRQLSCVGADSVLISWK